MTITGEHPATESATVVRVLAGPFQAFRPLWIRPEQFAGIEDGVDLTPVSVDWLPRELGRQSHDDLAMTAGDQRLSIAARAISDDYASGARPLLLLPELSRQVLRGTRPAPGRMPITELLRLLTELGNLAVDVRLLEVEGLGNADSGTENDLAGLRDGLRDAGIPTVSSHVERIAPGHPAYWRMAVNVLTGLGPASTAAAARLLAGLSTEELERAAWDGDGLQVLEMSPPPGFVLPPRDASSDDPDPAPGEQRRDVVWPTPARATCRTGVRHIGLNGRKVAFVCEKLADRSGGAERVLVELANGLCRRGYQVDLLSHELRGKPAFYPLELGVVHTNLSPSRGRLSLTGRATAKAKAVLQRRGLVYPLDRLALTTRYAAFRRRLGEYIDAARPDVVVPFMPPAIIATALAETKHRPRLVASMHNAPEQDFENPTRWDPGKHARRRRLELMDHMDAITVLLPEYQTWYSEDLRRRTTVIPNAVVPVDPERLAGAERDHTILAVGRLADTKRHDLTLRAFARLASDFPDWTVKVYGVGPLADELTAMRDALGLAERAFILGHTPHIADEYLAASIMSHPARFEGFPLVVTEALASALPVVGFADCSGLNSLVIDDENGMLLDPGDGSDGDRLDALTKALRDLMGDRPRRTRLGQRAPSSMEPYQPEHVVDLWEQALFPNDHPEARCRHVSG